MKKGLIIKSISGEYTIKYQNQNEIIVCKPRGIFRYKDLSPKVGDYVTIDEKNKSIIEISKRKNDLVRPVICNVDKAFLVFSLKEPDLNLNLLDRMLTILEFNNIESIIVFTKLDLLVEKEQYKIVKEYYQKIGYKVYESSKNQLPLSLLDEVKGNICVLTGQSGVGKSTLLNNFDETLNIKTSEISSALNRGKHTTRHVELLELNEGYLADTPGFGIVDFRGMTEVDLSHSFVEFFSELPNCKFNHCLHLQEPDCSVKKKVQSGEILKSRYDNFLLFIKEIKDTKVKY